LTAPYIHFISDFFSRPYLTLNDKPWPGGVLGVAAITGLVSVFVIGKKMQSKDEE
jgi:hypothetical protein